MAYKIIVADKSPSVQKAIRMAFPESEFTLYPFSDGEEALKALQRINPDAVLCNVSLPNKDGYELAFHIKNLGQSQKIGIVLLKGAFMPLDREKTASLDCDAIIQEPFDSEELLLTVRKIIEAKKIPQTLPEEPVLEEEETPVVEVQLDEKINQRIKSEILEMERELEKRVKRQVLAELKEWFREEWIKKEKEDSK